MSLIAVLLASLLGSAHCAGMCGGFVACYSSASQGGAMPHACYHAGRLISYMLLGALAGQLGSSLNFAGDVLGLQHLAAISVGVLLILFGLQGLFKKQWTPQITGVSLASRRLKNLFGKIFKGNATTNWNKRTLLLGLLSAFLPCAWLYAYVAVAAGSGTPLSGTLLMAVFWLGTVPALVSVAGISRILSSRFRPYVPRLISILFIVAGFASLFSHFTLHTHGHHHSQQQHAVHQHS